VDQLHPQPVAAIGLAEVIHIDNVRVVEIGHHPRLSAEAHDGFGTSGEIRRQQLQGVAAFQGGVLRLIHLAHAAPAQ